MLTLHKTWIARDGSGKAALDKPRLLLARHRSDGICRLWPDAEVTTGLVLGEGIETCLAGAAADLTPVWACLSAGNLSRFPALPGLEALTILVDHDRAGINAAHDLISRYRVAGFGAADIRVACPLEPGLDIADLVTRGRS